MPFSLWGVGNCDVGAQILSCACLFSDPEHGLTVFRRFSLKPTPKRVAFVSKKGPQHLAAPPPKKKNNTRIHPPSYGFLFLRESPTPVHSQPGNSVSHSLSQQQAIVATLRCCLFRGLRDRRPVCEVFELQGETENGAPMFRREWKASIW